MNAATLPPFRRERRGLVILRADGRVDLGRLVDISDAIEADSLLVLNDAATLPASLSGRVLREGGGFPLELRLARQHADQSWTAIAFAEGSWRERTEARIELPALRPGERLTFASLEAEVLAVDPRSPRMVRIAFDASGAEFLRALYRDAKVIQYSYLQDELALWSAQTLFAGRPWAVEMPSAGHPLNAGTLAKLRRKGVEIRTLTHAAGLSSTGDPQLDAHLPLPERYDIPLETARAVQRARVQGRSVIAAGTTVVRALESAARNSSTGIIPAGRGLATLRLGPETRLLSVDAILTGLHLPGESHFELLRSFAPRESLVHTMRLAANAGMRNHEFGDLAFVQARAAA